MMDLRRSPKLNGKRTRRIRIKTGKNSYNNLNNEMRARLSAQEIWQRKDLLPN